MNLKGKTFCLPPLEVIDGIHKHSEMPLSLHMICMEVFETCAAVIDMEDAYKRIPFYFLQY